jgi:acyl carrier protein
MIPRHMDSLDVVEMVMVVEESLELKSQMTMPKDLEVHARLWTGLR